MIGEKENKRAYLANNISNKYFQIQRLEYSQQSILNGSIEILYVKNGELTFYNGNYLKIKSGGICFAMPFVLHSYTNIESGSDIYLIKLIINEYTNDMFKNVIELCPSAATEENYKEARDMLDQIIYAALGEESYSILRLYVLMCAFLTILEDKFTNKEPVKINNSIDYGLLNYLDKHYNEQWSLGGLAKMIFVSPEHLSRSFKKKMGINLGEYINKLRIQKSINDLFSTNDTIEVIAIRHGFKSAKSYYSYFHKVYNMTPINYRNILRAKS